MLQLVLLATMGLVGAQAGYQSKRMAPMIPEHCLSYMAQPHYPHRHRMRPKPSSVFVCFDTRYLSLMHPQCEHEVIQYFISPVRALPPIILSTKSPPSNVPFSSRSDRMSDLLLPRRMTSSSSIVHGPHGSGSGSYAETKPGYALGLGYAQSRRSTFNVHKETHIGGGGRPQGGGMGGGMGGGGGGGMGIGVGIGMGFGREGAGTGLGIAAGPDGAGTGVGVGQTGTGVGAGQTGTGIGWGMGPDGQGLGLGYGDGDGGTGTGVGVGSDGGQGTGVGYANGEGGSATGIGIALRRGTASGIGVGGEEGAGTGVGIAGGDDADATGIGMGGAAGTGLGLANGDNGVGNGIGIGTGDGAVGTGIGVGGDTGTGIGVGNGGGVGIGIGGMRRQLLRSGDPNQDPRFAAAVGQGAGIGPVGFGWGASVDI